MKDSSRFHSKNSKRVKDYVPDPTTEPGNMLKAMYVLNGRYTSITKGQIN